MKNHLKNKNLIVVCVMAIIIIAAFFLRTYQYHDWLYFKMDQSRDAFLIGNAVKNGPEYLPLLGPRAGATQVDFGYLRLGPAFYYFQYLSGVLFHSTTPDVFAYPDLFFSILTIPLLFFFLRLYFSTRNSLLITAMYAFSFIVVQYSRFAWNPNSLLFFTLLSFYGLLRFVRAEKMKNKIKWLSVWAIGTAIGSQLHFLGLFCLTGISLLFIFFHFQLWKISGIRDAWRAISPKKLSAYILIFLAIFAFISSPIIISDVMRKGENTKNFIQAFSTKPNKKPLSTKFQRSIRKQVKYYCLITTSGCYQGNYDSKQNMPYSAAASAILVVGIVLLIRRLKKENDAARRDFTVLLTIWITMFFILAIPLYSSLRPRFFIFVFPVPFILLGIIFEFLDEVIKIKKIKIALPYLITLAVLISNFYGIWAWFKEQDDSQVKKFTIQRTLVLKNQDGVTLGELEKAANYMYDHTRRGSVLYYYVKPEHVQPIKYLLFEKNDPSLQYAPLKLNESANAQYFAIVSSKSGLESVKKKYGEKFKVLNSQQFGQLWVYELEFPGSTNLSGEFKFNRDTGISDRVYWKDVFGIKEKTDAITIQGVE